MAHPAAVTLCIAQPNRSEVDQKPVAAWNPACRRARTIVVGTAGVCHSLHKAAALLVHHGLIVYPVDVATNIRTAGARRAQQPLAILIPHYACAVWCRRVLIDLCQDCMHDANAYLNTDSLETK